jgi:cysteine dioxygenase
MMENSMIKPSISLKKFISLLKDNTHPALEFLLSQLVVSKDDIDSYSSWSEENYTRNCIYLNEEVEIIVLCWKPGQGTPIHNHQGQKCWVYQVYGEIEEQRYEPNENQVPLATTKDIVQAGALSYIDDSMGYHTIKNVSNENAVTLHFYAEPFNACKVFDVKKQQYVKKELSYDTKWTL